MEVALLKFRKIFLIAIFSMAILGLLAIGTIKVFLPEKAMAQATSTTVGVTATVEEWLTFSVSPTTVTLSPALVDAAGTPHIGSSPDIALTLGTNSSDGWSIRIKGANGGLRSPTANYTISTVPGTSTLSAGIDGYGANATSSLSGVTIGAKYNYWGTDTVGEITTTDNTLAQKGSPNTEQQVALMKIKAAANVMTPSGNYSDTITLTALPSIP